MGGRRPGFGRGRPGRGPRPAGRVSRPGHPGGGHARRGRGLSLREVEPGVFELLHPACVEEMWLDYEEGLELWKAGEPEDARDALRYALEGCGDNLWVHVALGRIALETHRDSSLARGHFGYAVELVRKVLPRDFQGRLSPALDDNRPFYDAVNGLIACYEALGHDADVAELRRWVDMLV